jgi:hypothetical protein
MGVWREAAAEKSLSDLLELQAGVILLSHGMYYLDDVSKDVSDVSFDVYKNARLHHNQKDNLVKLFYHKPYDEGLCAFYITDSGHWVGYNLVPYYKRLIVNIDIGPLYGIDDVGDSVRESLEWSVRKKGYLFYGTDSINTPPLSADALYLYKASDDAIWGYIPFR